MSRTTGSALGSLFVMTVLVRMFFPSAAVSTAQQAAAGFTRTPAPSPSAETATEDGPWKASQRYFAGVTPDCGSTSGASASRRARWCIPGDMRVLALIAIAPDPVRTHMALQFDRTLEGLQLAAQAAGYVVDQYWLPWSVEPATTGSNASKPNSGGALKRNEEPGIVVFRRDASTASDDPRLLLVFLVTDTPTGGVDGRQFGRTVTYVDEVCSPAAPSPAGAPG